MAKVDEAELDLICGDSIFARWLAYELQAYKRAVARGETDTSEFTQTLAANIEGFKQHAAWSALLSFFGMTEEYILEEAAKVKRARDRVAER